jgi:hypothetical protein
MFKREKPGRVVDHLSVREIADTKKKLKCELRAAVYFYDESKFIVCAVAGNTEDGEPAVLDESVSNEELGLVVCDALLAHRRENPKPGASGHLADWPAYQVSGAKSGKAFESNSWYVQVRTINTAIRLAARPRVSANEKLNAAATISEGTVHVGIGQALRQAIEGARAMREAGLV